MDAESDDLRPGGRQEASDADRLDPTGPLTLRRTLVSYVVSDAWSVISGTPVNARLTGHPALAALACSTNAASSSPGTSPTVTSAILVMVGTPSTGLSVTVASVCTDVGGVPA